MEKTKLNILPVPTYSWLGVNYKETHIEINETDAVSIELKNNDVIRIDAEDGKEYNICTNNTDNALVIIKHSSDASANSAVNLSLSEGTNIKVVEVFTSKSQTISKVSADVKDNANFRLIQVYLGGSDTASEILVDLAGRKAAFDASIAYLLDGEDKLDINLVADHHGRKTTSDINVKGVMNGKSAKTFKGTIDFKNGSFGSKGAEKEEVLLLSDDAVNKTVPLILCAEEDVEGTHGASIGRVDEEHIYYMQSRGIPEDKIVTLMARSKIAQVVKQIGDEQTERYIDHILGWGDDDE